MNVNAQFTKLRIQFIDAFFDSFDTIRIKNVIQAVSWEWCVGLPKLRVAGGAVETVDRVQMLGFRELRLGVSGLVGPIERLNKTDRRKFLTFEPEIEVWEGPEPSWGPFFRRSEEKIPEKHPASDMAV